MKRSAMYVCLSLLLSWAGSSAYALSEVHIDFQPAGATTAGGYAQVTNANRWDNSTVAALGGGVQGAWLDYFPTSGFNRSGYANELTRDGLSWTSSSSAETFKMTGLQPGSYDLKIYCTDPQFPDKQTSFAIDVNNDSVPETTITIKNNLAEHDKTVAITISAAGILQITVDGIGGATGAINALDLVSGAPDTIAPAAVSTLAVTAQNTTQIALRWTAPADDLGAGGAVGSYDVRYSSATIDEANWATAIQVAGEPTPLNPGQQQTFAVSGLAPSTTYFFAVKSTDGNSNTSAISNIASGTTDDPDLTAPAAITNLSATAVDANQLTLTWTATGDDGTTGTATSYNIRYSTAAITDDASFAAASAVPGAGAPKVSGQGETFLVTGLTGGTIYYFAMKVADEVPNWSSLSNVLEVATLPPDLTPPAAVSNLAVTAVESNMITLTWTAPGDDADTGTAVSYDMRYSISPITDANWTSATQFAGEPTPLAAGAAQQFIGGGLQPSTTYYFALKTSDNGVPANISAISNIATGTTLPPREAVYAITNEFSLDASPAGPYDPAVPAPTGDITITGINVPQAGIVRAVKRHGPVHSGTLTYSVTATTAYVHVWLEISTDGGATWSERRIHAVGGVGTIVPGANKTASWLVDGDHGNHCKIRIRVNDKPATYSDLDVDNNKMPRPVPWVHYPLLERMTDKKDFNLTSASYQLPKIDFYKALTSGQVQAGFARMRFFHPAGQYISNPQYFLHCCYLESADGLQKWVILQGDVQKVWTDTIHAWRNQIAAAYGIPQEHVMVFFTHVHNGLDRTAGNDTFPTALLDAAIANKQPVEVGLFNQDMGTTYNVHRNLFTNDAVHATSSYSNGIYDGGAVQLPIIWEYDANNTVIGAMLDGRPFGYTAQKYFDCPLDSYLQMLVFRHADTHEMKGVIVKFTMHPVCYDYAGDQPRAIMDRMQAKFGTGVEVMFTSGFGSNHRPLTSEKYPVAEGSLRVANAFADALEAALPTMEFAPLYKLGMVMGFDQFGAYLADSTKSGTDPDRLGTGVQVFRFNDIYLSTLPGEAPSEQGLYIRARTYDTKHMYNAYGNTWYNYYTWGRWFDIQHYEGAYNPDRYESFRMAQEIVRGVDILEQSVDALHAPADIDNDGHCDVVDLLYLVETFGLSLGEPGYNPDADFNRDDTIDVVDLLTFIDYFGKY